MYTGRLKNVFKQIAVIKGPLELNIHQQYLIAYNQSESIPS